MDEDEKMKIKLAQLREADIKSLRDYYENEIKVLGLEAISK